MKAFATPVRAAAMALALAGGGLILPPAPAAQAQQARPDSFADLAERLSPAVVNISTRQSVGSAATPAPNLPPGAPFGDLFRDFFERNQRGPRSVSSLGSGFVIDPAGFVVTNNHVIENADEIVVNFIDGSSLPATLVGTDPKTDIAVLKIEPTAPLPAVPFGVSDRMRVGDWVMAIGNPFGLGGSVSVGIVSARNRDINAGPYDDFIQTDAAINRGNSGGPLFNMAGEVIGVNTAIISPSGGSIGIGFAVPSDIVRSVVAQLREFGETRRGWLGVRIQSVTPEIAESLGLPDEKGALVADVTADGPADVAGILPGDVVLRFNGRVVPSMRDLPRMVADSPVGDGAEVVVWRKGEEVTVSVLLGRLEEGEVIAAAAPGPRDEPAPGEAVTLFGMRLEALTDARRGELDLGPDVTGVVVARVDQGGAAAEKGVRPGDVIVEVGQQPVAAPEDVATRLDEIAADGRGSALFLLQSGGELRFVALSLSAR